MGTNSHLEATVEPFLTTLTFFDFLLAIWAETESLLGGLDFQDLEGSQVLISGSP